MGQISLCQLTQSRLARGQPGVQFGRQVGETRQDDVGLGDGLAMVGAFEHQGGIEPGDFHSVVSCFATHHVDPERRVNLYLGVRRALRRDGVFVNGDRFVGEAPAVHEWEHESWVRWMATRIRDKLDREVTPGEVGETQAETDDRLQDRPGTVWDMRKDMLEAGFRYVDCLLKTRVIAVLAASGSAAPSPSLS